MSRRRWECVGRWTAATAVFVVAGCGPERSSQGSDATVTDSAGVEVVESRAPVWTAETVWRVAPEPGPVIGRTGTGQELFGVRGAIRLEDGRIVVADHGSSQLRYFDAEGSPLFAVGGPGQGPGEFSSLGEMWRAGDSLYVFEYSNFRMSVLSVHGDFGRVLSFAPGADGRLSLPEWVFDDGSMLVSRGLVDLAGRPGLQLDSLRYALRDENGVELNEIARLPDSEYYTVTMDGRTMLRERPFGLRASVAVGGGEIFFASSEAYRIEVYSPAGDLERVLQRLVAREPVGRQAVEDFEASLAAENPQDNPMSQAIRRQLELPELMPAHGSLLVDATGHLWVARYERDKLEEHVWSIFDRAGRWLGDVETTPGGQIFEIGTDYVLGVWRDEFDVEEVRLYRITKPQ